jgi:hypothetical protein
MSVICQFQLPVSYEEFKAFDKSINPEQLVPAGGNFSHRFKAGKWRYDNRYMGKRRYSSGVLCWYYSSKRNANASNFLLSGL